MTHILCASCGEYCGKLYPPTDTDPAFREGKGENFVTSDREWCCSEECLDTMNGDKAGVYVS
jgi:hypothetical protein